MRTRGATKREAAFIQESLDTVGLSSPPTTPSAAQDSRVEKSPPIKSKASSSASNGMAFRAIPPSPAPNTGPKRKRKTKKAVAEPVSGGFDILPHGLGKKGDLANRSSVDYTVSDKTQSPHKRIKRANGANNTDAMILDVSGDGAKLEKATKDTNLIQFLTKMNDTGKHDDQKAPSESPVHHGRAKKTIKIEGKDDDVKGEAFEEFKPQKKRSPRKKMAANTPKDVLEKVDELINASGNVPKKERKKKHKYGLTPGYSPFPNHIMPTPEACEEVNQLLSELHGVVGQPEVIPPPSMDVTGCGEVPDLLDAILRTKLSASTSANNANLSLKGLKDTFGLRTSGVGKGSVNWEAVHDADLSTIIESIKSGGLAKTKGTDIKKILAMVYEQNRARRNELLKEKETEKPADVLGANHETQKQKNAELARFDETLLSMDHVFEMTTDEAMEEMTKLPGIGVKTASCVILFCMKRPSFAVDTHVWRHCKWLGWVPEKATRDQTFSHCEVRIPDHLKYSLHRLFLRHGKTCGRCRANTSAGTKEWDDAICPIEHLVTRNEVRKMPAGSPVKKTKSAGAKKGAKGKRGKKIDDETEDSVGEVEGGLTTEESEVEAQGGAEAEQSEVEIDGDEET